METAHEPAALAVPIFGVKEPVEMHEIIVRRLNTCKATQLTQIRSLPGNDQRP